MDQIKILKRALNITINYRVLWLFGMLLALTAGGGGGNGGGSGGGNGGGNNTPGNGGNPDFNWRDPFNGQNPFAELQKQMTPEITNTVIGVAIALACLILVLTIIGTIVRYVSETALIRMVDRHENSGEKLTVREGFRMGWSRAAWKMFLADLLISLVSMVITLAALLVAALPLLVWQTQSVPLQVLGTVISVGLILLVVFAAILVALALALVMLFARRVIALEELGVIESIRRGYSLVRARLGDIILMAVIMFGLGILWALLMFLVFLAIIVVAAVIAGLPALLAGGITGLFVQGHIPWVVAAIVGAPIFLIAITIPMALVGGWQQVFSSSAWTLTYREVLALAKTKENGELPAPQAA